MPDTTRRDVLRAAFIAPAVLTFPIVPSFASAGSTQYQGAQGNQNQNQQN